MIHSRITGTGGYLPAKVVTNEDLEALRRDERRLDRRAHRHPRAPHRRRRRVHQRPRAPRVPPGARGRGAQPRRTSTSSCSRTSTPDMVFPSSACLLQAKLGVKRGAAFDVQAVCSGFVYALATADLFIRSGAHKCALVVGAEVFSRILDWKDRGTCVLFGDGAGAVVLEASDDAGHPSSPAARRRQLREDPQHARPRELRRRVLGDPTLKMDGGAVFKLAVRVLEESARATARRERLHRRRPRRLHRAPGQRAHHLARGARSSALPESKCIVTVDRHANTSAASIPLALDVAVRDGRVKPGHARAAAGRGRRLHLGLRAPATTEARHDTRHPFPGPGLAIARHDEGLRRASRRRAHVPRGRRRSWTSTTGRWRPTGPPRRSTRPSTRSRVMLVAGVACWRAWREQGGPMPAYFAGHSLGEYTALVAAGALRFEDALPLVRFRAQAMQEAVPEGTGGIAAILGLDEGAIQRSVRRGRAGRGARAREPELARPGRDRRASRRGRARHGAREGEGRQARRDAADERAVALQPDEARRRAAARAPRRRIDVRSPPCPWSRTAIVEAFDDPARIRQALVEQLYHPVRWIETVHFLAAHGVTRMVECGPGKVLTGLVEAHRGGRRVRRDQRLGRARRGRHERLSHHAQRTSGDRHRRQRAASARASCRRSRKAGATVVGTSTSEKGAEGISQGASPTLGAKGAGKRARRARCRARCAAFVEAVAGRVRRRSRSWSTTPAPRATTCSRA